jgi:hypothetical protein
MQWSFRCERDGGPAREFVTRTPALKSSSVRIKEDNARPTAVQNDADFIHYPFTK